MMFCGKYSKGSLAMSVGRLLSAVAAAAMLLAACSEKGLDTENVPRQFKNRTDAPRSRKVLLLYSAGLMGHQQLSERRYPGPRKRLCPAENGIG